MPMDSHLSLIDGTPISTNFVPAAVIQDTDRLHRIRIGIAILGSTIGDAPAGELHEAPGLPVPIRERPFEFTRSELNAVLAALDEEISVGEFNAIVAALCNAGVAYERPTSQGYAGYSFHVSSPLDVLQILDQFLVAAASYPDIVPRTGTDPPISELVATLPDEVSAQLPDGVRTIRVSIRRYLAEATDTVRIANPYFDGTEHVLDDLAALPRRGVNLKLITRQLVDDPNQGAIDAVDAITSQLSDSERGRFSVCDFYDTNQYGNQLGATHAKAVIIDNDVAYLGSANLTRLSLAGNFELGVLLREDHVDDLVAIFEAMFDYGQPIPT